MSVAKKKPAANFAATRAKPTLHKHKLVKKSSPTFSAVFASAVGGGTIGSVFGVPGLLVGAAIGGGIGVMMRDKHA
jgi:hypothetical protein